MKFFKILGEKFKNAPKKEQKKIYAAFLLTVLAAVICVAFVFWNEICFSISPAWHLGNITENTFEKIEEEKGYLSKRLFGFDITEEAYRIELSANALIDGQNQEIVLSLSPDAQSLQVGLETKIDEVPVLRTLAVWDDADLSFSFPQIDNNRYFVPVANLEQNFRNTPFAKSLPFSVPEHLNSLSYNKIRHMDAATQQTAKNTFKQFLRRLEYGERKKETLILNGIERKVHVIDATCYASVLSELVSGMSLLYTDDLLKDTEISHLLSDFCQAIKGYAEQDAVYAIQLIEWNENLIGIKTDTFTAYFHSGLFLNGFNIETAEQTVSLTGDIQMQGGVMDFKLTRSSPSEEDEEKLLGVYLDRRARKLSVYTPKGIFETNVRCGNSTEPFAMYENTIYYKEHFTDFSIEVKPGKPEIPMGTTDVSLTSKTYDAWKNVLHRDIQRLLRDTTVFAYLFNPR